MTKLSARDNNGIKDYFLNNKIVIQFKTREQCKTIFDYFKYDDYFQYAEGFCSFYTYTKQITKNVTSTQLFRFSKGENMFSGYTLVSFDEFELLINENRSVFELLTAG
jgi:hypothetical protein